MTENKIEENVKFIRLSTGEDIISQIIEVNENENQSFVLVNPLKILYTVGTNPGYIQISMMEWVFSRVCDDQEFTLNPSDIITIGTPSNHVMHYYWETLETFLKKKALKERNVEPVNEDIEESDLSNESDPLQQIMDYLKNVPTKRRLH